MSKKKKSPAPATGNRSTQAAPADTLVEQASAADIPWWEAVRLPGYLLPALAAVAAYHGAVQHGFVFFDDDKAILYNQALYQPSISGFFTGQNLGMYAPITWIAYWLGIQLSGQEAWGHHLISLVLHAGNAVLLFAVLFSLFQRQWPALFTAILFAVHPVQAEAVSWAAATSTVLFAFFYLAGWLSYIRWAQTSTLLYLPVSIGLFLLAGLSKSAAVTLPLLLLATDFLINQKLKRKHWLSKIPYFLISLVLGLYTFSTRAQEGHDIESASAAFTALDRFWMISQTLWFYPVKLLLPLGFSIAYPFVKSEGVWHWTYYAAPIALAAAGLLVWKYRRAFPERLFAIALYLLPLTVMLPFRTVGSFELRSDRYVYISCAGLFLLIALLLENIKPAVRMAVLGCGASILAVLGYLQSQVWSDGVSLFKNCVDKTPAAALCQCNLAYNELLRMDFSNAARHYSETLRLDKTYVEAYNGRGQAYFQMNQVALALDDFTNAIQAGLSSPKLFLNRGKCLVMLNRPQEALPDLSRSLQLEPNAPETYFFRGFAYEKTGNPEFALQDYSTAIEQKPDYLEAYVNRGLLHAIAKKNEAAIADYSKALALNPNLPVALNNRANVLLNLGRVQEAIADLDKAIAQAPNYYRAYESRARAWQMLGRADKAAEDVRSAQRLRGSN
jgi:tetratricopeptide (TPR) repeat protein